MADLRKLSYLIPSLLSVLNLVLPPNSVIKGGYWNSEDLDPNTNEVTIAEYKASQFSSFTETVQQKNPSVKTLLSIGGGLAVSSSFSQMATNPDARRTFIDSSIRLARENNFHGLDLDWEYPLSYTDRNNYASLINEWRSAIEEESSSTGNPTLLLTAAVAGSDQISSLDFYPFEDMARSFDWINLMVYDLFIPDGYPDKTQPPAALRNPSGIFSGDEGISKWISSGIPADKLVMGLPFYGYKWTLNDPNNGGLFAPATNPGAGGVRYKDIVELNAEVSYDPTYVTNYAKKGTDWYGYDDTQSISAKVDYAKQRGLLGYFAWSVEQDSYDWTLSRTASQTWGW